MYKNNIIGKKLLILAGGPNLVSLVERAKDLGVYTVVSDYYDVKDSPAKLVADEYWNISWSDIDALEKKCKESGVNGVTTGYSENVVEACIKLCERLNVPCYCNMSQLEITRDKIKFKNECRKNGVPVVNEYKSVEEVNSFPIILKPTDRAGSIGIGIATNEQELIKQYEYAMEMSYNKHVVIEDFITNGTKFDVTYAVCDGNINLLATCDTINGKDNRYEKVVQSAWLYPSKYENAFLNKVDSSMKKMIKDLGINDGIIWFSGFAIDNYEDTKFAFFESGFRLGGEHMYQYVLQRDSYNPLDILIYHALTGDTKSLVKKYVNSDLKCLTVNYYAKDGVIREINGIEKIKKMNDCTFLLNIGHIGQKCDSSKAILSKITMIHFCSIDALKLSKDIEKANKLYSIISEDNKDIVYDRINPTLVNNWWKS